MYGKKLEQQRLIIDARYASQCCRRPPSSKLGTSATIGDVDLSDATMKAAGLQDPTLYAAAVDLTDCFYQFTVREMAEWFACEWTETAETWGVRQVWCPAARGFVPVAPEERLCWVFEGLPMGWSWSLFFAQEVMSQVVSSVLVSGSRLGDAPVGGLLRDGEVVPVLGPGRPVGAVYVDNATIVAGSFADASEALERLRV